MKTVTKKPDRVAEQSAMFGTYEFPTSEQIVEAYGKEFENYVVPKGDTIFGFWMQTLADLELLDLELNGLTKHYSINSVNRTVELNGNTDVKELKLHIAHLEKIKGEKTLYTEFIDKFGDTNAYGFHNLYPYKGKFYPRVVRTLINAFGLNDNSIILDPFNGSGTTTHEASLMGIESVGLDITPIGTMIAEIKNELLFAGRNNKKFSISDLQEIFGLIEGKKWKHQNTLIYKLMLLIYFDTIDAFVRTNRYNRKGKVGLFIEKFNYIKSCYDKLMEIKNEFSLEFKKAKIIEGDVLKLRSMTGMEEKFDAVITSPPYYFSIDYVGKDKLAYDYLGVEMPKVENKYLGMKNESSNHPMYKDLPIKVIKYYEDLKESIENIFWCLKPNAKCAIIVGDSTVNGKKIPTTIMTKKFCEEVGFKFEKLVFNPLLGARNRAIRGESIIICQKL